MTALRIAPGSPAYLVLRRIAHRNQFGRFYTTRTLPEKHDLTRPSSHIRTIGEHSSTAASTSQVKQDDFVLYPDFFSREEQAVLIRLALWKLDRVDPKKKRRRRRKDAVDTQSKTSSGNLQMLFEDKSVYGFEEGHFDSVISNYRESLITAFPDPSIISKSIHYPSILRRVYDLLPKSPGAELAKELYEDMVLPASRPLQSSSGDNEGTMVWDEPFAAPLQTTTHALHLSPEGKIDPHVDNVDASGSVIVGVSLGGERILRLEQDTANAAEQGGSAGWEVLLNSGSVYVQKDDIRYRYAHSILPYAQKDSESSWNGRPLDEGHRISLMIRDTKIKDA